MVRFDKSSSGGSPECCLERGDVVETLGGACEAIALCEHVHYGDCGR